MNKKLLIPMLMFILAAAVYAQPASPYLAELNATSDGVIITKYNGKQVEINLPTTLQGLPVTGIGKQAFKDNLTLNKITINKGVTEIQAEAFQGCRALSTVSLPETLKKIGAKAFDSSGLTAITIPSSCKEFGEGAFSNAARLKAITLPVGFATIPGHAFENCTSLATVKLPESIKKIEAKAFSGCTALTTFEPHQGVTSITFASDVFVGCSKINLGTQVAIKKLGYTGTF